MFYSQFILAKKGPLGTIWIAAHLERKLRKNQVADTDIGVSVDSILFPEMPIALRLSSHLLLGVVRIYSKKVNYLFDDCSEALLKVKQAFRSTAVDLPPEESTAPYHSITLPETFDLDDFELPDNDLQGNYVDQHISSKDQITLQDTMEGVVYTTSKFGLDERFGDGDASGLDLDEELLAEKAATPELATGTLNSDDDPQASVHANDSGGTPN
ncbi:sister chromatid cohesion 1 protein 4-like [Helianthus annuus]|nr:sister chromatid cohesion 1 protein 4-like [Helianthus annuus]